MGLPIYLLNEFTDGTIYFKVFTMVTHKITANSVWGNDKDRYTQYISSTFAFQVYMQEHKRRHAYAKVSSISPI